MLVEGYMWLVAYGVWYQETQTLPTFQSYS